MSLPVPCDSQSVQISTPFGLKIQNITENPVSNLSVVSTVTHDRTKSEFSGLDFCNITIGYTHPGRNDYITVTVMLPNHKKWIGRFQGTGGGGWSAIQGPAILLPAVDAGYTAAATDAGVTAKFTSAADWALLSPGNADVATLNNFASVALHDMTVIGKAITESYYRQPPSYSYWQGCSQGGRQGNMMAQRYPDDYDGILAISPAINYSELFASLYWPQQVMKNIGSYPPQCEIDAVTTAAVTACDGLDGIVDQVISVPERCQFDPISMVGKTIDCNGLNTMISSAAARLVQESYNGPRGADGSFLWHGFEKGVNLALLTDGSCESYGNCSSAPRNLPVNWFTLFIAEDPAFNISNMTHGDYVEMMHQGIQRYNSIIGTNNPDISSFRDRGGKLLTYHGLTDGLVTPKSSVDYYERVRALDRNVDDYFRLFLVPASEHCLPGSGPYPSGVLDDLVQWTEQGIAPEYLRAINVINVDPKTGDLRGNMSDTASQGRPICLFPKIQEYIGGDISLMSSFQCVRPENATSF